MSNINLKIWWHLCRHKRLHIIIDWSYLFIDYYLPRNMSSTGSQKGSLSRVTIVFSPSIQWTYISSIKSFRCKNLLFDQIHTYKKDAQNLYFLYDTIGRTYTWTLSIGSLFNLFLLFLQEGPLISTSCHIRGRMLNDQSATSLQNLQVLNSIADKCEWNVNIHNLKKKRFHKH